MIASKQDQDRNKSATIIGFSCALIAGIAAVGYSIAQILQVLGVVIPPVDAILIYGFSLSIASPYMLAILALHYMVPRNKHIWSHAALLFALMYATYVTLMYTVQLGVVIPQLLAGIPNQLLTATPHSLFWTLDALGYICLGLSTFHKEDALIMLANGLFPCQEPSYSEG